MLRPLRLENLKKRARIQAVIITFSIMNMLEVTRGWCVCTRETEETKVDVVNITGPLLREECDVTSQHGLRQQESEVVDFTIFAPPRNERLVIPERFRRSTKRPSTGIPGESKNDRLTEGTQTLTRTPHLHR